MQQEWMNKPCSSRKHLKNYLIVDPALKSNVNSKQLLKSRMYALTLIEFEIIL